MTDTKTKVAELKQLIDKIRDQIREIQSICPHENVTEKHAYKRIVCYDCSDYAYWIEKHCEDCGKEWDVELDGPLEGVDYDK